MPDWILYSLVGLTALVSLEVVRFGVVYRKTIKGLIKAHRVPSSRGFWHTLKRAMFLVALLASVYGVSLLASEAVQAMRLRRQSALLSDLIASQVGELSSILGSNPKVLGAIGHSGGTGFLLRQAEKLHEMESVLPSPLIEGEASLTVKAVDMRVRVGSDRVEWVRNLQVVPTADGGERRVTVPFGGRPRQAFGSLRPKVLFRSSKGNETTLPYKDLADNLYTLTRDGGWRKATDSESLQVYAIKLFLPKSTVSDSVVNLVVEHQWSGYAMDDPLTIIGIVPSVYGYPAGKLSYEIEFDRPLLFSNFVSLHRPGDSGPRHRLMPDRYEYEIKLGKQLVEFEFNGLKEDGGYIFERSYGNGSNLPTYSVAGTQAIIKETDHAP